MSDDVMPAAEVTARLERAAAETPYPTDAYLFVLQVVYAERGVDWTARDFCWRLRDTILRTFGKDAAEQLDLWSIHSTADFGKIIQGLAKVELVRQTTEDSPEDFVDVYDFERAFAPLHMSQWRLSTIFFITTVTAIAFAGAARLGLEGAIFTLFGVWMGVIGVACLFLAARHQGRGRLLAILFGTVFLASGAALFFSVLLLQA